MRQWVVTESYRVTGGSESSFSIQKDGALAKAMADGWRIVHSSSTNLPELYQIFVTYILEKPDPEVPKKDFKGLI
jgi:hypothetical protein